MPRGGPFICRSFVGSFVREDSLLFLVLLLLVLLLVLVSLVLPMVEGRGRERKRGTQSSSLVPIVRGRIVVDVVVDVVVVAMWMNSGKSVVPGFDFDVDEEGMVA